MPSPSPVAPPATTAHPPSNRNDDDSKDSIFFKYFGGTHTRLNFPAYAIFSRGFFQSAFNHRFLQLARNHHHAIDVAENQIAGLHPHGPDFDCTPVVHHLS